MLQIRITIRLVGDGEDALPPLTTEDCLALPFLEDESNKYSFIVPMKTTSPEFYDVRLEIGD